MSHLVLIVEDNAKNLKLVRDVLQYSGYRTLEAETAEKGIDLARQQRPDLVLLDIQLPGMDGLAAVRVLKRDPLTSGIPVVAVTASVMRADLDRIRDAGFDGYLTKPIDVKELPSRVQQFCEAGAR